MKLKVIGSNQTEVEINNKKVLFSYNTPVAYYDLETKQAYKTCKVWSNTTSKHINSWVMANQVPFVTKIGQEELDKLVA